MATLQRLQGFDGMLDDLGVDLFGFVLAEAAKFAEGQAFFQEKGDTCESASGESDEPEHHRGGYSGFLSYSVQTGESDDGKRLRSTTNAGELYGGSHHGEDKNEHGVGEAEGAELTAKAFYHQEIAEDYKKPMEKREKDSGE